MLCLSTAHLTFTTRELLEAGDLEGAIFFPKGPHGWFMYVPERQLLGAAACAPLPEDITTCVAYACAHGMQWLMFDTDGPILEDLSLYEEIGLELPSECAHNTMGSQFARNVLTQPMSQI